jgi:hypothetical protein
MGFPLSDAQSYGLFLESVLYGIYLVTCGFCLQKLLTSQHGLKQLRELNWPMLVVVFLLFGIATVDAVLQFYRNLHTFQIANGPGDATEDFTNISDPINVVKVVLPLKVPRMFAEGPPIERNSVPPNDDRGHDAGRYRPS